MQAIWAAILLAGASQSGEDAPLKNFEFRDLVAGKEVSQQELKPCKPEGPDTVTCVPGYIGLAGTNSFVMETFHKAKLSKVVVSSQQVNWPTLRAAFQAKYGEPCRQTVESWQNAAGAHLDNIVEHWCFATGELSLHQYGSKITETLAVYEDENEAPRAAPKIDF